MKVGHRIVKTSRTKFENVPCTNCDFYDDLLAEELEEPEQTEENEKVKNEESDTDNFFNLF
jgi:ribosomal protein L12E/L44/L45/RPP1/RPP2